VKREISSRMWEHISVAATAVNREYPAVPAADLRQEGAVWAFANPRKAAEYEDDEDTDQGDRMIYASLRNRLRWCAQQEVAQSYGYRSRSQQFAHYSVGQLEEELLPALFDPEAWTSPPKIASPEITHRADPAHGGTWMAMLADVADAYAKLPEREREMLRMKYAEDVPQRTIARRYEITDQSVSEALHRAVLRILRHLGGEAPAYVPDEVRGTRRAMTNAAAQAETQAVYDG